MFAATAAAGFMMAIFDPGFQGYFLGPAMMASIEKHQMWTNSVVSVKPLASSTIMTNNLTVSFTTFAFGIAAGIGTLYMLAFNGLLFGVVSASCWQAGMAGQLFSFVVPHGVLELPAIFIAGGAGLLIAKGLLFSGALPRRESLVREGSRAMRLALGIIPLLIIAGTVEGFVSPTIWRRDGNIFSARASSRCSFRLSCAKLGPRSAASDNTQPSTHTEPSSA